MKKQKEETIPFSEFKDFPTKWINNFLYRTGPDGYAMYYHKGRWLLSASVKNEAVTNDT